MGTEVLERQYTADELTTAMDQLHALSMATWRELLAHVAEYDAAGAWRADGMASMADWLIARYGLERSTAHEWVRTARALTELPAVAEAVSNGRLSADQTRWTIRLADPATDEQVAAEAPPLSAAQLRLRARLAKPPKTDDTNATDGRRSFRWRESRDGNSLRVSGRFTPDDGATLAAALTRLVPLAHDTLRRLACDARVQLLGEGPGAEALARTAMEHTVPHWLRRQLTHRDGGCRWKGCQRTRALHAHHLVWFSKGGKTTLSNLVLLCRRHHRAIHEGGWRIEGDPAGTLQFIRPTGIRLPERPPPLAPDRREWLRKHLPNLDAIPRLAFEPG